MSSINKRTRLQLKPAEALELNQPARELNPALTASLRAGKEAECRRQGPLALEAQWEQKAEGSHQSPHSGAWELAHQRMDHLGPHSDAWKEAAAHLQDLHSEAWQEQEAEAHRQDLHSEVWELAHLHRRRRHHQDKEE